MPGVSKHKIHPIRSIRQSQIVNGLNALHYKDAPLLVFLEHNTHSTSLCLKAYSSPVGDEKAILRWCPDQDIPTNLTAFSITRIIINTRASSYEFKPNEYRITAEGVGFVVPESGERVQGRSFTRYTCLDTAIKVSLTQNAISYSGKLIDFSSHGFMIELNEDDFPLNLINTTQQAILSITSCGNTVYTGITTIEERSDARYLLLPSQEPAPRYMPKEYRARRQRLVPPPDFLCTHPISGKNICLKISEVSSLGFSLEESLNQACLIPGLLIRDAKIVIANNFSIACSVQVVNLRPHEEGGIIKVGLAILSLGVNDHLQLISLIQQAKDPSSYISNRIDASTLFDFFFETGFIYPSKYVELADKKEEITESYMALYEKSIDISRHFTYQSHGQVLGHFASLRVYSKTWLNQHHAAYPGKRFGLQVVRAASEYINDSYRLNPINMKYIIGFFREENRFPKRYFGNYVRQLDDLKKTSLDNFSYFSSAELFSFAEHQVPEGWSIQPAEALDVLEFHNYYQAISGGLMTEAIDLLPRGFNDQGLNDVYKNNGLRRKRLIYSLRAGSEPVALIDVQSTDFGLNLSEITNTIFIYLINPTPEAYPAITSAIKRLSCQESKQKDPVMVFPSNYFPDCTAKPEKEYTMWSLNIPAGMDSYMSWMNRYCK